jgi:hypothetical protein
MRGGKMVTSLLTVCAGAILAAQPAPADDGDDGGVVVTPGDQGGVFTPPTVDIGVHTPGQAGSNGARATGLAGSGASGVTCSYSSARDMESWLRHLPSRLPSPGVDTVDPRSHLYARICGGQPVGYVWLGPGQQVALALPTPAELAQRAYRQMVLAVPAIHTSPAVSVPQLVRVPTWLWIDSGIWSPRSRTAAVPGLSATATARPVRVTWWTGDGSTVVCRGPGSPFRPGVDRASAASPDCGHTYLRSSASAPGGVFTLTATIDWAVSWAGGRQAGTLPALTSTSSVVLRVTESQALNDQ